MRLKDPSKRLTRAGNSYMKITRLLKPLVLMDFRFNVEAEIALS
jgi:hypothetical protein